MEVLKGNLENFTQEWIISKKSNVLPEGMVESAAIVTLKWHFDRHLNRQGLEGYNPNAGKWD